jgi:ferredoxin
MLLLLSDVAVIVHSFSLSPPSTMKRVSQKLTSESSSVISSSAIFSKTLLSASSSASSEIQKQQEQLNTSYYAAAGAPKVDMSKYNLPSLDTILSEWTAVVQTSSSTQDGGVFLTTKTKKELFIDTLSYAIPRSGGLGLLLTEIAGGRSDGIGITIIEEVLANGNAAQYSGLLPGDSIISLSVSQSTGNNVDTTRVATECLSYDATIDAITSLPIPMSENEVVVVTVKRIRRQPKVTVKLQYPPVNEEEMKQDEDVIVELYAGENLRRALLTRGIKLNDKLAIRFDSGGSGDCGADGTCATCVVGVTKGLELLSPMTQQESQILSAKPRWRMACKAIVGYGMMEGELTLQVNPRQWS